MEAIVKLWLIVSSGWGFCLCFWDKQQALKHRWRIPEKTFFLLAFLGGAFGIRLGMRFFHHKTRKSSFFRVIDLALGLQAAVLIFWLFL